MSVQGSAQLPDTGRLEDVLGRMLGAEARIAKRTPNVYASSYPSEIIACRAGDGRFRRALCKYGPAGTATGHGHRGGVSYEGAVYRHVLAAARMSTPRLWGVHHEREAGRTWLVIEYVDGAQHVRKQPSAMGPTAAWIGRFHATMEGRLSSPELAFLTRYDRDYFNGWPTRADRFVSARWKRRAPWWAQLCERFEECSQILLEAGQTVIHGECYPNNVICTSDAVRPVDWESAAVAAGEIDLASLLEGWPEEIARDYIAQYSAARWPSGSPAAFARVLDAARVYLGLRWLGDEPALTASESSAERFDELQAAAMRLGLIA